MGQLSIEEIKRSYPKTISKDQLYRICHISKKTALYLLESGLIPCRDSGKATRRFKIRLDDVIIYLMERDIQPLKFKPPQNYYKEKPYPKRKRSICFIPPDQKDKVKAFYKQKLSVYKEVLTTNEVSEFLGYSQHTVVDWCEKREIKCFYIDRKYRFPQEYLIDFMLGDRFNGIRNKSDLHTKLVTEALSMS